MKDSKVDYKFFRWCDYLLKIERISRVNNAIMTFFIISNLILYYDFFKEDPL